MFKINQEKVIVMSYVAEVLTVFKDFINFINYISNTITTIPTIFKDYQVSTDLVIFHKYY